MPSSSCSTSNSNTLISFYAGTTTDSRGRLLSEILQWDAYQLEVSHDYIQILFPLPEESAVNWNAPVVSKEVFEAFRGSEELRAALGRSFRRLAWFYGFDVVESEGGEVAVVKGANFPAHSQNWNTRFDHNHLRITRIIRSLRVLGLEAEALAFYRALEEVTPIHVSKRSREYWRRAAERSLNIRPDAEVGDEQDDGVGLRWLSDAAKELRSAQTTEGAGEEDGDVVDS